MNQFCLITGATGGLGKVLARSFWDAGYSLFLHGRKKNTMEDIINSLPQNSHQQLIPIIADLANPQAAQTIWQQVEKYRNRLEILINNAAIHGPIGKFEASASDEWEEAIRVNLLTPVALCRYVVPHMKERGFGRIICLSGGGATSPRPLFSAYATAKAGLVRFCENLAVELQGTGVTVNSIAPGAMKTALIEEIFHKGPEIAGENEYAVASRIIKEGGASPKNVAQLCLFLASAPAAEITGKLISAKWDNYEEWPNHSEELQSGDLYTLRRITGRDRGITWGDK